MSEDIKVQDGVILECLNDKVDLDGKNYVGSPLEEYIHKHCSGGKNMFDVVQKDHILTFEESKGLVPFGDYAYKTGSDGTRYGYPDFYEKCLKEYNEAEDVTLYTTRNFAVVDTSTNTDFALTENLDVITFNSSVRSFSTLRYVQSNTSIASLEKNKPFVVTFTTGADVSAEQAIVSYTLDFNGFLLRLESGKLHFWGSTVGTKWDLAEKTGITTLVAHTTYTVYVNWDGATYTVDLVKEDGTRTTEITVASTSPLVINSAQLVLGLSYTNTSLPFRGRIHFVKDNEVATYITDQWKPYNEISVKHHANEHVYYDITDVDDIDYLYNTFSEAWLYGVDATNERIRAPRDDYYSMSPSDIANVYTRNGQSVDLDTVQMMSYYATTTGGLVTGNNNGTAYPGIDSAGNIDRIGNDDTGSHSSYSMGHSLYVKSTDVIKKKPNHYLYICVGNTEIEVASTEVTEVTTTENDTVPLFTGQYFDFKPNNISWLAKDTVQSKSGKFYETTYNELVKCLNEVDNVYNIKVIDVANMVEGVDYSLYWKVDKENMTFTTPSAISSKCYKDVAGVAGNGMALGLTDGVINAGLYSSGGDQNLRGQIASYASTVGSSIPTSGGTILTASKSVGITTDSTKSGIEAHLEENTEVYLYFKVGNAVANKEIIDVGTLTEIVNNKIDINSGYVDGQFVSKVATLDTSTAIGTYTMDLSEYIPNDGYDYMVLVSAFHYNPSSTGSRLYLYNDLLQFDILADNTQFSHANSSSRANVNWCWLPVSTQRYLTKSIQAGTCESCNIIAYGYRRIGKNQ